MDKILNLMHIKKLLNNQEMDLLNLLLFQD